MNAYIDLDRRFRQLSDDELEDPEQLAAFNEPFFSSVFHSLGWDEILAHPRILLLATAGAGKTREMTEQVKRLNENGKFAFFIPLEELGREELRELLPEADIDRFEDWESGPNTAWFFLDSVDELKLTKGSFKRALQRLRKAIGGNLARTHIVISSRPTDWKHRFDAALISEQLPISMEAVKPTRSAKEVFMEALRDRYEKSSKITNENVAANRVLHTVVLLPLSNRQIDKLASSQGLDDTAPFLEEVQKRNAWTFARQPLDLIELLSFWKSRRNIGTRAEQHELNVLARLKDKPDRPDHGVLSDSKALDGAQRLALAIALTRIRTIRSPEQALEISHAENELNPATLLKDWTEEERQALLRRPIFDPATYGRVRFHHRSIQEFLAAKKLLMLRNKGMPIKGLFRLLFAEVYGHRVTIPSMRPIAAWLSLWDDSVRRELISRTPEALVNFGDPESFGLEARTQIVEVFCRFYGEGGWRGLELGIDEVQRLAHPGLAGAITRLWENQPSNKETIALLLDLIWLGPVEECMTIASRVAFSSSFDHWHRVTAVRALLASQHRSGIDLLSQSLRTDRKLWSNQIVAELLLDLFPRVLDSDHLFQILLDSTASAKEIESFGWRLRKIVENLETKLLAEFCYRMAEAIWSERSEFCKYYQIEGRLDSYAGALTYCCMRLLETSVRAVDPELIRASLIAYHFNDKRSSDKEGEGLAKHFEVGAAHRASTFWLELAIFDDLNPDKDASNRFYHAQHRSILGSLTDADCAWLELTFKSQFSRDERSVALEALIWLWRRRGRNQDEVARLVELVTGDDGLESVLLKNTEPPKQDAEHERSARAGRRYQQIHEGRKKQEIERWNRWHEQILTAPEIEFSPEKVFVTIRNIFEWFSRRNEDSMRYDLWDGKALRDAFSEDVAMRSAQAFQRYWRGTAPELWSERAADQRNSTPYVWIFGLCGVSSESSLPQWAEALSDSEARLAVRLATVEINGFPGFLAELGRVHGAAVEAVLGDEMQRQAAAAATESHLPILQNLTHAEQSLKVLMCPRLMRMLCELPMSFQSSQTSNVSRYIDQMLSVLFDGCEESSRSLIARECAERVTIENFTREGLVFLRGLFRFAPEIAVETVEALLSTGGVVDLSSRAVDIFSSVFGRRDGVGFEIDDPNARAKLLGRLLRQVYAHVRPSEDQRHSGSYSPDVRDDAQEARGYLLSALIETPGPWSQQILASLAEEQDFSHFPDRLRILARERAAKDAEFKAFDAAEVSEFESRNERVSVDMDSLFSLVMDRLEDIQHDLTHHDFTDRSLLAKITDEIEMQRALAAKLYDRRRGAYIVTREEEVADRKKPDLRVISMHGDVKAAIEVKVADAGWTIDDLDSALSDQLVRQYLRHKTCAAGVLLLTYGGHKNYWIEPVTKEQFKFKDVVARLAVSAQQIEAEMEFSVKIAVFGLDLTGKD